MHQPQVYCISSGKTLPQWLSEKKRRSLKKDDDYRRRLELLQDLHFPTAAQRLKVTPDGEYLFASGIHPPQVRGATVSRYTVTYVPPGQGV